MRIRTALAAVAATVALPLIVACGADDTSSVSSSDTSASTQSTSQTSETDSQAGSAQGGGPGNTVDVSYVTTEDQLIALIQEAYGDASLGLHRGHQPIESVLDDVLEISHDELHVRMEQQGQNLAAVAEDLGIDPQTLVDALVDNWAGAVESAKEAGGINDEQAEAYLSALAEAFTWRINWDGAEATPAFDGVDA